MRTILDFDGKPIEVLLREDVENIKAELLNESFCADTYDEEDNGLIYVHKVIDILDKHIGKEEQ